IVWIVLICGDPTIGRHLNASPRLPPDCRVVFTLLPRAIGYRLQAGHYRYWAALSTEPHIPTYISGALIGLVRCCEDDRPECAEKVRTMPESCGQHPLVCVKSLHNVFIVWQTWVTLNIDATRNLHSQHTCSVPRPLETPIRDTGSGE
ncbi:hypothetical protein BaRGS_00019671, partial [Batillaria attramentaria]